MIKRMARWMATGLGALTLVACGGGGGGTSLYAGPGASGPAAPTVTVVDVLASASEMKTGGVPVTISAIVKGAGNVSLANTVVSFSADTGSLTSVAATTDAAGVATAKFTEGTSKANRPAVITVTAGGVVGSINLPIVGTSIALSGPTTLQLNNTATLSAKVTDGSGAPVVNLPVTVASALGNGLANTGLTTNSQGVASVVYSATNSGTDSVQVNGAGVTVPLQITISGQDFAFVAPAANTNVPVNTPQPLTVRYRVGGAAQPGATISFTATAGTLTATTAVTDALGQATVSISATTASPATVQASLAGNLGSATLPIEFVATNPSRLVLQATPTAVPPNQTGSTTNQSQLVARVTDANGNPVKNQTVNFSRDADPSGGNLSVPSAVTDSGGQATVQFLAGPSSTASEGVVIRGTVAGTVVTGTTTLTVSQAALFIALGTGNTIENIDSQTYKKNWTVYVTDSNGVAVPNISLTIKALPLSYGKGELVWAAPRWVHASGNIFCLNEDLVFGEQSTLSFNGVLDSGEDINGNGLIEPGNVISVTPGVLRTDATGRATLSLIYAESYAPWVEVALQAQAIVSGTESKTRAIFVVSGSTEDFTDEAVPPAGRYSPFGANLSCSIPN